MNTVFAPPVHVHPKLVAAISLIDREKKLTSGGAWVFLMVHRWMRKRNCLNLFACAGKNKAVLHILVTGYLHVTPVVSKVDF